MEEKAQVNQPSASVDWLPSLFQAIESVFNTISSALQPGIVATQAYFQQLLDARPVLYDPLAQVNENKRSADTQLMYAGAGILVLLLIAIVLKNRA